MPEPSQMERVRAARALLIDARGPRNDLQQRQQEMDAFMSIFHPGHEPIVLEDDQ